MTAQYYDKTWVRGRLIHRTTSQTFPLHGRLTEKDQGLNQQGSKKIIHRASIHEKSLQSLKKRKKTETREEEKKHSTELSRVRKEPYRVGEGNKRGKICIDKHTQTYCKGSRLLESVLMSICMPAVWQLTAHWSYASAILIASSLTEYIIVSWYQISITKISFHRKHTVYIRYSGL